MRSSALILLGFVVSNGVVLIWQRHMENAPDLMWKLLYTIVSLGSLALLYISQYASNYIIRYHQYPFLSTFLVSGTTLVIVGVIWLFWVVGFPADSQLLPLRNASLPNLLDELDRRTEKESACVCVTRTFWLWREEGAQFTIDRCPGDKCMRFELGKLGDELGTPIQEIMLSGGGFGLKRSPNSKYFLEMRNPMRFQGAYAMFPLDGGDTIVVTLGLKRGNFFELYTNYGDVKLTVLDTRLEALRVQLEIKRPSGFQLGATK